MIKNIENFTMDDMDSLNIYSDAFDWLVKNKPDEIDWQHISMDRELTEEFIEKYINYIDLDLASRYQNLSENFMIEHQDKFKK